MRLAGVPVLLASCLLAAGIARAADMPVLRINDTNEPPFTTADNRGFLDAIAGEAFHRAGVKLKLIKLPAERALRNVNAGIDDGDLTRIAGLEAEYPNLVRVPEKLIDWEFVAFSRNPALPARWETLRALPVGHIRGWKIYERELAGAPYVVTAEDPAQLFRQLQLGRIDVALYARWQGLDLLQREGISAVHMLEPVLARREMFLYLHKRHASRVPQIAAALRAIKAEGLYARLYREKVLSLQDRTR